MTDDRRLAARLAAERLAELEQALDAERSSAEPDWDRIEALSQEAAALLVQEEDIPDGKQALLAALAEQEKPPVRFLRWGHYAAAAAVAGIALILVPAAIRWRHAVDVRPPVSQTDSAVYTETTLTTTATETAETVTTPGTEPSQTETQTRTAVTGSDRTETETAVTGTADTQFPVTQTTSGTRTTESTASGITHTTGTESTAPSSQRTGESSVSQSWTVYTESTAGPGYTGSGEYTGYSDSTGGDYTSSMEPSETTTAAPLPQTVNFRTVDAADPSQAVPGAEMQIFDMDGNLVLTFRSGSEPVQAELLLYTEYRLHAVSVPAGWQLPRRDMVFTLKNTNFDIPLKRAKEESP